MFTEAAERHRRLRTVMQYVERNAVLPVADVDGAVVRVLILDAVVDRLSRRTVGVALERIVAVQDQHTVLRHTLLHAKAALPDPLLRAESFHVGRAHKRHYSDVRADKLGNAGGGAVGRAFHQLLYIDLVLLFQPLHHRAAVTEVIGASGIAVGIILGA